MTEIAVKLVVIAVSVAAFAAAGCASIGCGPDSPDEIPDDAAERYADAMCATYERCDCIGEGFPDADACRTESIATFKRVKEWPGVTFDDSCFEDVLDFIKANDCGAPPNTQPIPCDVFKGTVPRGEKCEAVWSFEGSAGGLTPGSCDSNGLCALGRCVDPPGIVVEIGEPCRLELGVRCGQGNYCASDGTCREQVELGGQCDTPLACDDQYCAGLTTDGKGVGVCMDRIDVGETCNSNEVQSCAPGYTAYCTTEGTCATDWPTICEVIAPPSDTYDAKKWVPF